MLESAALIITSSFKKPPSIWPCQRSFVYCPPNPPVKSFPAVSRCAARLAPSSSQRCLTSLLPKNPKTRPRPDQTRQRTSQLPSRRSRVNSSHCFCHLSCSRPPGGRAFAGKPTCRHRQDRQHWPVSAERPAKRQQSSPVKSSHLCVVPPRRYRLSNSRPPPSQLSFSRHKTPRPLSLLPFGVQINCHK